jgi:hypothetical protein
VKDAPQDLIAEALSAIKEDFQHYWGARLCNVLRALNHIKYAN